MYFTDEVTKRFFSTLFTIFQIVGPEDQRVENNPNTWRFQNSPTMQPSLPSYTVNKPVIPEIKEKPQINRKTSNLDIIETVPKYPPPEVNKGKSQIFRIALIGESLGTLESGIEGKVSYLKMGKLMYTKNPSPKQPIIKITWDEQEHEKGMKLKLAETEKINTDSGLSELIYFNGYLITISRSSSQIYRFTTDDTFRLQKWIVVNKNATVPPQLEWATVTSDDMGFKKLYVGSTGTNDKSMKVFAILKTGGVIPWSLDYDGIKKACSVNTTLGYATNTTSFWSKERQRCFFIPKKVSKRPFNAQDDVRKGSNIIVSTNYELKLAQLEKTIGAENPELSYTSARFLPNNHDEIIVALQNSEVSNDSYITVFNFNTGEIIYTSTLVSTTEHMTYSGLEFISM